MSVRPSLTSIHLPNALRVPSPVTTQFCTGVPLQVFISSCGPPAGLPPGTSTHLPATDITQVPEGCGFFGGIGTVVTGGLVVVVVCGVGALVIGAGGAGAGAGAGTTRRGAGAGAGATGRGAGAGVSRAQDFHRHGNKQGKNGSGAGTLSKSYNTEFKR